MAWRWRWCVGRGRRLRVGSSKKPQTIGYWYRPLIHFGWCQGPIDAFLEFRGGDRTAWKGEATASSQIYIDAMGLWGGEKSEGGIAGYFDLMFGEETQEPNGYLAQHLGPMQPAYRGVATGVFRGGRYGAMNPYPKPASFLLSRTLKGWDGDEPWYPEKVRIPIQNGIVPGAPSSYGFNVGMRVTVDAPVLHPDQCTRELAESMGLTYTESDEYYWFWRANESGLGFIKLHSESNHQAVVELVERGWQLNETALLKFVSGVLTMSIITPTATPPPAPPGESWNYDPTNPVPTALGSVYHWTHLLASDLIGPAALFAMNPAHIIYDSLVSESMQGEPASTINEASFMAAADTFFNEAFGLCTKYDADAETVQDFRQRICNVVGARCSRSRVDGQWYLDVIRKDFDLESLPVLTDDDIIDFKEQDSTQDDAVNQVTVKWFDRINKEERMTAPVQALGAIMAAGGVNPETVEYLEIPTEVLALRAASRDLHSKATPPRRFELVCKRKPYAWRTGQRFRLQTPKRGIADMVCMVGDIDAGTLRSGAIRQVAVRDHFSMPDNVYVVGQGSAGGNTDPRGAPQQRLFEVPYYELVRSMRPADFAVLPEGVGTVGAIATRPSVGLGFNLYTHAEGEEFAAGGTGEWCPAATFEEATGYTDTVFTVAKQADLSLAAIGSAVLWEREICRLIARDEVAGTIELARGCADTVPERHAAGTVAYFYEQAIAGDGREYADGETVSAKLLTVTGSSVQSPAEAPTLTTEIVARKDRPYPPGQLRINGQVAPDSTLGEITVSWVHRDRVLQADQLVDHETASIGPEAGTTYTVRYILNGALVHTDIGLTVSPSTYTPTGAGLMRVEVESVRDGLASYQMHVREFSLGNPLLDQMGATINDQADQPFLME